jgi:hypothetical protein
MLDANGGSGSNQAGRGLETVIISDGNDLHLACFLTSTMVSDHTMSGY